MSWLRKLDLTQATADFVESVPLQQIGFNEKEAEFER
jgi:hypothetical protein